MSKALEDWKYRLRNAPDEDLLEFREAEYLGMSTATGANWRAYIDAVDDELRRRNIE